MNTAYKHLDAKLRIAELTIGQWIGVVLGVAVGVVWGLYVSPFGSEVTLITAVYLGSIPAGAALLASVTEFNLWRVIRSAVVWRRLDGRYIGGAGSSVQGYALEDDAQEEDLRRRRLETVPLDLETLWEDC